MKGFKKLLLFLVLPIILMSCDRKPDLAYEDACVHPNALKEIKYYVKHNISEADGLLIAAKINSNEKIVKELLKSKNIEESEKLEALWRAIDNKNIKVFDVLLKATKGENSFSNKNKETILMKACKEEKIDIVKRLIKAGANVNIKDNVGMTALGYACFVGNLEIVNTLIAAGADINTHNILGAPAMAIAMGKGNKNIVNVLLAAGADVNIKYNSTLLIGACELNDLELAKNLLAAGAEVNAQDEDGKTALMIACEKGNKDIASTLLATGADIKKKDNGGATALIYSLDNISLKNILLEAGADPKEIEVYFDFKMITIPGKKYEMLST